MINSAVAKTCVLAFLVAGLVQQAAGGDSANSASITSDKSNARIDVRIANLVEGGVVSQEQHVEGEVSDPHARVWLLVETRHRVCWLHGPAIVGNDGTFSLTAQFGELEHVGEPYTVRAVVDPPRDVQPGKTKCGLDVAAVSSPVRVIRR